MIEGDLVRLSAYGRKINGYQQEREGYGLVIKSSGHTLHNINFKVVWFYPSGKSKVHPARFSRKDLKLFKPKRD